MKKRKNTTRRVTVKKGKIQPRPPKRVPKPGDRQLQPRPPKRPSPGGQFQPKPRPKPGDRMVLPPRPRKTPTPKIPRSIKELTPEQRRRIMELVKKGRGGRRPKPAPRPRPLKPRNPTRSGFLGIKRPKKR